jgi:hypothetical protein
MNLLPRWLRSEARHQDDEPEEFDPGDMGTAFGLDATLAPCEDAASADVPEVDAATWQQRLDRRPRR